MSSRFLLVAFSTVCILAAQDPPARVGRLNFINGTVSFQPGGEGDWVPAAINRPLTVGDQIFADDGARAEIHVPGVAFRLGSRTAFEFLNLDDRTVQVRLSEGTLDVRVRRMDGGENLEVDTPNMAFTIQRPGDYRIDTNPDNSQSSATARYGDGEVTTNAGAFAVHQRQQAVVSGQDQVQYSVYDAPADDEFDSWARSRDQHEDRFQSSRYVSPNVVGYEDLDDNGSWQSNSEYGEVWIPRGVPSDWAPYHYGHWAWIDPWGWSWVDDAPWGFAPFHYGRWASFDGRWGWVPGPIAVTPVYAPALVAWFDAGGIGLSVGFGGGGAGWFPLGPRDVYIPAYQASPTYVTRINTSNTTVINNTQITNVYNNYVRTGNVPVTSYSNRSVPGAAMAAPQNALASARPMQQAAVRVSPAQVNNIKTVAAAPRVAPQVQAVLGSTPRGNVPRPSAAVLSKPIVAKSQPPAPPPSFQQRQASLAKNPGRPIPIQQQHQMAQSAPSAPNRPPVRVMTQARQVTPTVVNKPAPRPGPGGSVAQQPGTAPPPNQAHPNQPAPSRPTPQAQPNRPFEPPSAQRPAQQAQPNRPAEAPRAQPQPNRPAEPPSAQRPVPQAQPNRPAEPPRAQPQPNRPFEPPSSQRPAPQAQPSRPAEPSREQPRAQPQPQRPAEPPPAQRPAPQAQPTRPVEPPREQPRVQPQPQRPAQPPPAQRPAPQAQPSRPVEPPREQPRAQPQPQRPSSPPPQEQRRAEPPARPQERQVQPPPHATPPPAKPRPTEEKNDKKKNEKSSQ